MSPIKLLKFEAMALKERERASGRAIKYREALEQVARRRGFQGWHACCAVLATNAAAGCPTPEQFGPRALTGMRRYRNTDGQFALDIPARWITFPPVANSSPFEVIRFKSHEDGSHFLIILRQAQCLKRTLAGVAENAQKALRKEGFLNFASAETTSRSGAALMYSFDRPHPNETWSFRNYLIEGGMSVYTLGFGTNNRSGMFALFDRIVKTLEIHSEERSFRPREDLIAS